MPAWLVGAAGVAGSVVLKMVMALLTESFIKKAVIQALEFLVARTESQEDDRLLAAAKEAWEKSSAP